MSRGHLIINGRRCYLKNGIDAMNRHAWTPDWFVPLSPDGETLVPVDPAFREACYNVMRDMRKDWVFGNELFSETDKLGKIFRVDFTIPSLVDLTVHGVNPPAFINRAVCSQKPGEEIALTVAIGQKIPPLPINTPKA